MSRAAVSRQATRRRMVLSATGALLGFVAAVIGADVARAHTDGGALPGILVTVATDGSLPGNHTDPHVSGSLISYTDDSSGVTRIGYYDLTTGVHRVVPFASGDRDLLSDISGSTIVFTRINQLGSGVYTYDVETGVTSLLGFPNAAGEREHTNAAIGGDTVAWEDTSSGTRQVLTQDLSTGAVTVLSSGVNSVFPSVSPDGRVVAWGQWDGASDHVGYLRVAQRTSAGGWSVSSPLAAAETFGGTETDGSIVAYVRDGIVRWQPVGGGTESSLPLPGEVTEVSVADGVVAFVQFDGVSDVDAFAYDTADDTLYSVGDSTTTLAKTLIDIAARPDGSFVVTHAQPNSTNTNLDLFAHVTPPDVRTGTAPSVTISSPSPDAIYRVGDAIDLAASFTDSGSHSCSVSWGDGTDAGGTVTESGGGGTCNAGHVYTGAGVYTISTTVTDAGGSSDTETVSVVVYNPDAGFVTGAGWIHSPAGAYAADPTLADRARFGFVSQYKKGAAAPAGRTDFRFDAAGLIFESSSYQWLVVSGAKAQYKGVGRVNGLAGYGFLLTAKDGQAPGGGGSDAFRIKIWEESSGDVVYDNQMGEADGAAVSRTLGGGQIVIHTK